ncbi:MAG: hypothetical protein DMG03_26110 [Acidobacteria bacterium]|nr:MAG: hypothetical protein DMG03_26110 [Acidobacteriota bacterium]
MNSGGLMPAMKTDTETDVRQIDDILRRIEAAENAGDATAMIDLLAEDAVIMALASLFEQFDRRIAYVSAEVRVIGEYAFDRGSFAFSVAPRSGGDTSRETGKYLFLYSRAADGSWKIARAIVHLDAHESEEA